MHYLDLRWNQPPKNLKACATCSHAKGRHGKSHGGQYTGRCGWVGCPCERFVAAEETAA